MDISAGFDFSWNEASFSVIGAKGEILFDNHLPLSGRDASALPAWMLGALKEKGLDFNSIAAWTVGSGPGSFTGMRIATAFVGGLSFGRDSVRKRSMPTACAMAYGLTGRIIALFDGRKSDLLSFPMTCGQDGSIRPDGHGEVLEDAAAAKLSIPADASLVALEKDRAAIESFFGAEVASRVRFAAHVRASALALNRPGEFDSRLSDLVYIRPAVFVEPKAPRII